MPIRFVITHFDEKGNMITTKKDRMKSRSKGKFIDIPVYKDNERYNRSKVKKELKKIEKEGDEEER